MSKIFQSLFVILLFLDVAQICSKDVLNHMAENMDDDWFKLIELLNNNKFQNYSSFIQMQTNDKSGEENNLEFSNETKLMID